MASAQPRNSPPAPAPATPARSRTLGDRAKPAAAVANIVRRDGLYHLLMRVQGQWLETGITARRLLEITEIADREFAIVHVNAPLDNPPAATEPSTPSPPGS